MGMAKAFAGLGATIIDTVADLPAAAASLEGLLFFQKDTNELKICNGASWVSVIDTDAPFVRRPYCISNASASSVNTTTPTTIATASMTTLGNPVFIVGAGDCNLLASNGYMIHQIYVDGSAVGKYVIAAGAPGAAASQNMPFACIAIVSLSAGSHTFDLRAYNGVGGGQYGELGNAEAPTILAFELT